MEEDLRNNAAHPQERGLLHKDSPPATRVSFHAHSSLTTSSPALQRPSPRRPQAPAGHLRANTPTSGEPQGPVDPSGTYNDVGFGLAESTEPDHDIWRAEHVPFYRVCQFRLESHLRPVRNLLSKDISWGMHPSPT